MYKSKIFIDEYKLLIDYIPTKMPHREEYIRVIKSSRHDLLLLGRVGTGKTHSVKRALMNSHYVHLNCYKLRGSLFAYLMEVCRQMKMRAFSRGVSSKFLFDYISSAVKVKGLELTLVFDDADYAPLELVSTIISSLDFNKRVIVVVRDEYRARLLSKELGIKDVLYYQPYSSKEVEDILWARVDEQAINPLAVDDNTIKLISYIVGVDYGGPGDCRLALELLWRAGKYAELDDRSFIELKYVRMAYADVVFSTDLNLSECEVKTLNEMNVLVGKGLSCPLKYFDRSIVEKLRNMRLALVEDDELIPLVDLRMH